jgi:predicted GTPase
MTKKRVLIMGAAGRDFHNFNINFRKNNDYEVVTFTATQIPDIDDKVYPFPLSGELYPNGIPIQSEDKLVDLIKNEKIDVVVFAYSDVSHEYVMHKASTVMACGADFWLLGAHNSMIKSEKPMISVCATRTGCGKSQTTRRISDILHSMGKKVVSIRHPMPYGDIAAQAVQRFATIEDLKKHKCTIEEMEEYEPHIAMGNVIYAGVDYEAIVRQAEQEADIILWDGGNNDLPFYTPDLEIVVVDPHRVGHELTYHPGETNLRRADVIVINKEDTASAEEIAKLKNNIKLTNPTALVIDAESPLTIEGDCDINGKRILAVEDGPTLTHGDMKFGAAIVAAKNNKAAEIIDPRPFVKGKIAETFEKYPHIGTLLPAMGYGDEQMQDLEDTINAIDCDLVVIGTPIDLNRVINIKHPTVRVQYSLKEIGDVTLETVLKERF